MSTTKKSKTWIKPRHRVVKAIVKWPIALYCKLHYHLRWTVFDNPEHRQFFILTNHQTPFDQFFTGIVFKDPIYYVATEDIFSIGAVSRIIEYVVAPIPFRKGSSSDMTSIRSMVQVASEGGSIALCPEGNRTYSGVTESIKPSVAKMVKLLKLPVLIIKFEGGFGIEPRWADDARKGKMYAHATTIIEPEEYKRMSNEDFAALISRELYQDDAELNQLFDSNKRAEYVERLLYYCPHCGFSSFKSEGNSAHCCKCNRSFTYMPDLTLKYENNDFPYTYLKEWYRAQESFIKSVDPASYTSEDVLYTDSVDLYKVHVYQKKEVLSEGILMTMTGDGITFKADGLTLDFPFEKITSMSILGHNKIGFYSDNILYQIKGETRFNAIKYVHYYYHYMNVRNGESDDEFLGL